MAEGHARAPRPEPVKVSIGEFHVAGPGHRLAIHGLGSCVAILLHDPAARLSGLGHFLLPHPPRGRGDLPRSRFVSTGVPDLVEALRHRGAQPSRLVAKLAGAAQMFRYEAGNDDDGIGARNLETAVRVLRELQIRLLGQDTGGSYGRTILVDAATGRMEIRAVRIEERIL
ncbi:MAG: chemotaxis protein CheD [Acidobacteriota bacterium]|jgi:chemotaxis protein CheD